MTYVEFFDKTAAENISACLTDTPDRVIYLGDNLKLMKKHIARYEKLFSDRGEKIEFLTKTVSKSNLDNAVEVITEIVEAYDDCVFDITGGEEILNLALGVVYAKYPDKNLQIHKINLRNNVVYDCDKDGSTIFEETPKLSVEENIRIYGGDILYGDINGDDTYKWELTPGFVKDISRIWSVCKGNVRLWNTQIGVFEAAEEVGSISGDGLTTTAKISAIDMYLSKHKAAYRKIKGMVNCLLKQGLLTFFDDSDETELKISYKNPQVKKCLTKAGLALEMKVYISAKGLLDNDGNPVYNDVMNGVLIDWDGAFHNEEENEPYDTENEIDILMMHDMVPVFVSCKNGIVTADELYKLNTVAQRFGGKYAKKVLVATSISVFGEAGKYLRQRAQDMNIKLIENIQELDDGELSKKLKTLWCN